MRDLLVKHAGQHKYDHGHALVLAGGSGRGGAARLAAHAALRAGAGLVTLACPADAVAENAARLDAVMLREAENAADLGRLLEDARINALCLGPGFGLGAETRAMAVAACGSGRSVVLDADALTSFADAPEALFDVLHGGCVLTPHAGEFARLFGELPAADEEPERAAAVAAAARRSGAVVLLKGALTLVAAPDGTLLAADATGPAAAPWLATAGSGDVLAGMVCGLLARGIEPPMAGAVAAWLHAECARRFGPGLIAEDLADALPGVYRDLGV